MLGSWNATARADMKQDGINYPRLSVENLECLRDLRKSAGHYLGCAVAAALVLTSVAFALNHCAKNLIGVGNVATALNHYAKNLIGVSNVATNVAAVVALGLGTGSVVINLEKARLKRRERELTEFGKNNAQELFEPLSDSQYSVSELETRLTNANALVEFHRNQGGGQPYADGFIEEAIRQAQYITVGQFGQDLREDIQIERFVICLTLAQIISDDRPEKQSALDECNQLIIQPGFVQKLASYMVSDSSYNKENQLIINSDYAIFLEEEMYNLCRAALVTLAVISKNEYMRDKMNKYHPDRRLDVMLYSSIVRCARIDKDLAPRLKDEIGIDIIGRMRQQLSYSHSYFDGILSNDEVAAISEWSGDYRDPLAKKIDALSAPPPVMPAINPASNPQSRGGR